ncbi:NAD-dependent epimerase/dehydratase family protein [Bacillus cytotoxicus]|uniref:NAD-dependent epimerase/dehydratase family protein n=1 Tax=Bacillus cytotoxicus TaxID=580165 RepID=UPI001AED2FDC|nr:NAD(P)-dependent oxidoreductase [Bacillus cytotoxicus]QTR77128.1 NAD(P)-dependent oxidoreductase [Bacillus cytotoxicus]
MNRVLIIGALTFVGYHLVNKMLAEDIEVYGIDFADFENISKIEEEKLMLIGRNALFTYSDIRDDQEWHEIENNPFDAAYFCLCEPNQNAGFRKEQVILQYLKRVTHMCEANEVKLNVVSSIEVGNRNESENKRMFMKIEEEVKKGDLSYSIFRVPTLYGPWQPTFMIYHQLMLSEINEQECELTSTENRCDLLYVEDVCEYLLEKGTDIENIGVYNLISGKRKLWEKGMHLLNANDKMKGRVEEKQETFANICMEKHTPLEFGLNKQFAHVKKYKRLYEG